jgi:hypothetical protein
MLCDIHENYVKQSLRNRIELHGANGRFFLTVPVVGQDGIKTPLKDIRIEDSSITKLHMKSIRSAYGSSPFFIHFEDELEELLARKHRYLLDLNVDAVQFLNSGFGLELDLSFTKEYCETPGITDERSNFKKDQSEHNYVPYYQVFAEKNGFESNLSALDLLLNEGPGAAKYLMEPA